MPEAGFTLGAEFGIDAPLVMGPVLELQVVSAQCVCVGGHVEHAAGQLDSMTLNVFSNLRDSVMGFALNDEVPQDLGKPECGSERMRTARRNVLVS